MPRQVQAHLRAQSASLRDQVTQEQLKLQCYYYIYIFLKTVYLFSMDAIYLKGYVVQLSIGDRSYLICTNREAKMCHLHFKPSCIQEHIWSTKLSCLISTQISVPDVCLWLHTMKVRKICGNLVSPWLIHASDSWHENRGIM